MRRETKQGFTIIEVVLVLAIAGLIFLMVFIALPALQRSQRNTQRRDDYSMLVTAVNSYLSSNNGKITSLLKGGEPTTLVAARWVNDTGDDPNGNPYEVIAIPYGKLCPTGSGGETSCTRPTDTIKTSPAYCLAKVDGKETKISVADKEECASKSGTWEAANPGTAGSQVYIVIQANCNGTDGNGDPEPSSDDAARSFAVYGYLEGGGYFCQASGATGLKERK